MTFEYTPPPNGASDDAVRALNQAHRFKPNTKHAEHCPHREIPPMLRMGQKCTCKQSPTSKSLAKLRCMGVLVDPLYEPRRLKAVE